MILRSTAVAMLALLVGCAAVPQRAGESLPKKKVLNFPAPGQKVHVSTNGLIRLSADYSSFRSYSLKSPLSTSFALLGRVSVSTDDVIWAATLEEKSVFCTLRRVYIDPLVGPTKEACFIQSAEGMFGKVTVAPGAVWFTKDLEAPIAYTSLELPIPQAGPYKTELYYEGFSDGKLFLSEKIYEQRLDSPSRIRPLIIPVGTLPAKVTIGTLSGTVAAADQNSMTFIAD